MGLRFYRRVHLFPGVGVNLSRSGPSLTLGVRGAHATLGRRGVTRTVGLPGTGVYYTSRTGYHSGYHSAHSDVVLDPRAQAAAHRRAEITLATIGVVFVIIVLLAL
jgi:Protein of unknown function (DUF4236)